MAYRKDVWHFPGSNEYEYKFIGNYGAKGEKRHKRQKHRSRLESRTRGIKKRE